MCLLAIIYFEHGQIYPPSLMTRFKTCINITFTLKKYSKNGKKNLVQWVLFTTFTKKSNDCLIYICKGEC